MSFPTLLNDCKLSLRLAAPLVGSRLLHIINGFINMVLIAKLGSTAIATSALIFSTTTALILMALAMLFSVAVIVGKVYGEGNRAEIGQVTTAGLLIGLVLGGLFTCIFWHMDKILLLLRQPPELVALAAPYFHIFSLGVIPSIGITCFHEVVIGISRSRLVILWDLFGTPLNIGLSYGLLFGKFGLPQLGIVGAAYASTLSYWALFIGVSLYFYFSSRYKAFDFFGFQKEVILRYIKKIIHIGWPISLQLGAISASYCFLTYMMGWLGKPSLAAHHIANQWVTLTIMVPYGMAQASGVLVAQARGSNRMFIASLGYAGVLLSVGVVVIASLLYWFAPEVMIALYIKSKGAANMQVIHLATTLLALMGIIQLTDTVGVVLTGALRGFHDTTFAMGVGIGMSWVLSIPLGYYLATALHCGAAGIYIGFALGSLGSAVMLSLRFRNMCRSFNQG